MNKNVNSDILEEWGQEGEATNCSNVNLDLVSEDPKFCFPKHIYKLINSGNHYFILPISRSNCKKLFVEKSLDSQQMHFNYNEITKAHRHGDTLQTKSLYTYIHISNQLGKILIIYDIGKYGGRILQYPRLPLPDVYIMCKSLPLGVKRTYKCDEISLL